MDEASGGDETFVNAKIVDLVPCVALALFVGDGSVAWSWKELVLAGRKLLYFVKSDIEYIQSENGNFVSS